MGGIFLIGIQSAEAIHAKRILIHFCTVMINVQGIYISKIIPGGAAAATGRLRMGDRLLSGSQSILMYPAWLGNFVISFIIVCQPASSNKLRESWSGEQCRQAEHWLIDVSYESTEVRSYFWLRVLFLDRRLIFKCWREVLITLVHRHSASEGDFHTSGIIKK